MAFRSQPDPNHPSHRREMSWAKGKGKRVSASGGVLGLGFTMDPWKKGVIFGKNMIFVTTENGDFKQFMGVWSTQKCGHLREHGKHIAGECSGTCWNIEWCEYLLRKHQSQLNLFNPGVIYPSDYISIISLNIKHQRLNKNTKPPQFRHGNQANSTQIEPILYWLDFELYLKQHISCVSCTIKAWWFFQLVQRTNGSITLEALPGRNLLGIQQIDKASRQGLVHARDDGRRDADDAVVQALPELRLTCLGKWCGFMWDLRRLQGYDGKL